MATTDTITDTSSKGGGFDLSQFSGPLLGFSQFGPLGALAGWLMQGGMFGGDEELSIQEQWLAEMEAKENAPFAPLSRELAGGGLESAESRRALYAQVPVDFKPAARTQWEQEAAINQRNLQNFQNWQNMMRSAYQSAAGSLGRAGSVAF